jgi:hypothetical protein
MRRTIWIGGIPSPSRGRAARPRRPDIGAVLSGEIADPIGAILAAVFGTWARRSSPSSSLIASSRATLSLQAAASRCSTPTARDRMIVGDPGRWRASRRAPARPAERADRRDGAAGAIVVIGPLGPRTRSLKIISFAALGHLPRLPGVVLGALSRGARGWRPSGKFTLGRWGMAVNVAALDLRHRRAHATWSGRDAECPA